MKHIVLITTSFPEKKDGREAAGSFVYDFALELTKKASVSIIAPGNGKSHKYKEDHFSINYYFSPNFPLSILKLHNPLHIFYICKVLVSGKAAVKKILGERKVDHILAFWVLPSGYWAMRNCLSSDIKYSTWALGSDIWSLSKIPIIKRFLKKTLLKSEINFADGLGLANDVKGISKRACSFLPSTRNLNSEKIIIEKKEPPYNLAYLGRWHRNKGIDLLLDSLSLLDENDWELINEVRICGGGSLVKEVNEKVSQLKEKGAPVYCDGFLDKKQAKDFLEWSDYVMIPSRIESIPVIFSDAMQCGSPVICTPVGDLPLLIKKYKVGVVAEGVTALEMSLAIKAGLRTSPKQYSKSITAVTKEFSIKNSVNVFLDTIGENTKQPPT